MAEDKWPQVSSRKDKLQKWLRARGWKTTGRKQELIERVIKARNDGTETIEAAKSRLERKFGGQRRQINLQ